MRLSYADGEFSHNLNAVKQQIFGRSDFALHRREILDASTEPFTVLADPARRAAFDQAILEVIERSTYRVVTVVLDKKEHHSKYVVWHFQPYHYCMTVLLERYVLWLNSTKMVGDVMVESRGKTDNMRLEKAYRFLYKHGTGNVPSTFVQRWLSSKEIKIKPKAENIAGLQLADLIANPSCRDLICQRTGTPMKADFGKKVVEILYRRKYRRNPLDGTVQGWGTKWLP